MKNAPKVPQGYEYLWEHFLNLDRRRNNNMNYSPISNMELQAYQANYFIKLKRWEIDLIFKIDDLYIKQMSKEKT